MKMTDAWIKKYKKIKKEFLRGIDPRATRPSQNRNQTLYFELQRQIAWAVRNGDKALYRKVIKK